MHVVFIYIYTHKVQIYVCIYIHIDIHAIHMSIYVDIGRFYS